MVAQVGEVVVRRIVVQGRPVRTREPSLVLVRGRELPAPAGEGLEPGLGEQQRAPIIVGEAQRLAENRSSEVSSG